METGVLGPHGARAVCRAVADYEKDSESATIPNLTLKERLAKDTGLMMKFATTNHVHKVINNDKTALLSSHLLILGFINY